MSTPTHLSRKPKPRAQIQISVRLVVAVMENAEVLNTALHIMACVIQTLNSPVILQLHLLEA